MRRLHIKYLSWITVFFILGELNPIKAESEEDDHEIDPTEAVALEVPDRHQQLMMEHQNKVAEMKADHNERRTEMMHQQRKFLENHKPMMVEPIDHSEELIEEHDKAIDMIGRPSEEESPNPGEPVIP
jgi:hypothetical protein